MANQLGFVDPDELAERLTPEMLDERIAHYAVDPWGDEWAIGATIAAEIANGITRLIYARAGKAPKRDDLVTPGDFIPRPHWMRQQEEQSKYLTDEQAQQELRKLI